MASADQILQELQAAKKKARQLTGDLQIQIGEIDQRLQTGSNGQAPPELAAAQQTITRLLTSAMRGDGGAVAGNGAAAVQEKAVQEKAVQETVVQEMVVQETAPQETAVASKPAETPVAVADKPAKKGKKPDPDKKPDEPAAAATVVTEPKKAADAPEEPEHTAAFAEEEIELDTADSEAADDDWLAAHDDGDDEVQLEGDIVANLPDWLTDDDEEPVAGGSAPAPDSEDWAFGEATDDDEEEDWLSNFT